MKIKVEMEKNKIKAEELWKMHQISKECADMKKDIAVLYKALHYSILCITFMQQKHGQIYRNPLFAENKNHHDEYDQDQKSTRSRE